MKNLITTVLLIAGTWLTNASAVPITSANDPALSGATLVDFEATPTGTYPLLTFGNLTITGALYVGRDGNGAYVPPNDAYLGYDNMTFSFAQSVSAFGLAVGATNAAQTLTAYDRFNNVIEMVTIPDQVSTQPYPYTGYYGINADANTIAKVVTSYNGGDRYVVDDIRFATQTTQVPEPISMSLMGLGLFGIAATRKRKA